MTTEPRDTSALDAAVLAHRADPTEENRERLMAAQRAHADGFYREQTVEFQRRTRGR